MSDSQYQVCPSLIPASSNVADNLLTRISVLAVTIVSSILVARTLGAAGRGEYAFLLLMGAFIVPLTSIGLGASVTYYVSTGRYSVREIALTCLLLGIAHGVIGAALVTALSRLGWLGTIYLGIPVWLLGLALTLMPVQGANMLFSRMLMGDSRFRWVNRLRIWRRIALSILLIFLVVVAGSGIAGAMVAVALSETMLFAVLLAGIWLFYRPRFRVSLPFAAGGYAYGTRAWPAYLAGRANLRIDQWFLALFGHAATLGNYAIAVSVAELLWMAPDSLGVVLMTRLAREKDSEARHELTCRIHRMMCLAMCVASVFVGVAGMFAIPLLYGPDFDPAVRLLLLLLPGAVAMASFKVISKFYSSIGQPGRNSLSQVLALVLGIPCYLAMIHFYGAPGAAIASSVVYGIAALASIIMYRRSAAPRSPQLFRVVSSDLAWMAGQVRRMFKPHPQSATS